MTRVTSTDTGATAIDPDAVIDWTKDETSPRRLIKLFDEVPPESDEDPEPTVRTDIDISVKRCDVQPMKPSDYGIVTWDEKGKTHLDKRSLVQYLKGLRIVYDGPRPYIFNGFIYEQVTDAMVESMAYHAVESIPGAPFPTRSVIADVLAMLRATSTWTDVEVPEAFIDDCRYDGVLAPFQNGIYNITTDELLPFTPYLFLKHQLGAWYNPAVQTHPVSKIYDKILPDKATRRFFFEMVGFALFSPRMSPPAIFVIYGPGNTGKSALQQAVQRAIGIQNISKMSIAQICDKFMTIGLKDKLINICGETGSGQNRGITNADGELIKQLSEGQTVMVDIKHRDSIPLTNTAKLWFITNSPPDFGDNTSGLYRRLYIVPCRVEQRWEDQIYSKLTEDDAVSWLVNRSLLAYRDFQNAGFEFHVSKEMRQELTCYRNQEGLMDFYSDLYGTSDRIVVSEKLDGVAVQDLYDEYTRFMHDTGGKPLSKRKFSEKTRNEFRMETETTRTVQDDGRPTNRVVLHLPAVRRQD